MNITIVEKNALIHMISNIVQDVYPDLAESMSHLGNEEPTSEDVVEPVYFHLYDAVLREFGNSHELMRYVANYDPELTTLIKKIAKSIIGS